MRVVIVTVVKGDVFGLKRTEQSILQQSEKVHWVLITPDNQSGTAKYALQLHSKKIVDEIISDLGGGVYAAMNLAMESLKSDDWIWFLNAGDEFAFRNSYESVLREVQKTSHSWLFGGHFLGSDQGAILGEIEAPARFKAPNQLFAKKYVSHQAVIFKNSFLQSLNGFRTNLKVAADWDLLVRASHCDTGGRIPEALAIFYMGGLSTRSRQTGNLELLRLRSEYLGKFYLPKSILWFGFRYFRNKFVQSFERTNPNSANLIRKIRLGIKSRVP